MHYLPFAMVIALSLALGHCPAADAQRDAEVEIGPKLLIPGQGKPQAENLYYFTGATVQEILAILTSHSIAKEGGILPGAHFDEEIWVTQNAGWGDSNVTIRQVKGFKPAGAATPLKFDLVQVLVYSGTRPDGKVGFVLKQLVSNATWFDIPVLGSGGIVWDYWQEVDRAVWLDHVNRRAVNSNLYQDDFEIGFGTNEFDLIFGQGHGSLMDSGSDSIVKFLRAPGDLWVKSDGFGVTLRWTDKTSGEAGFEVQRKEAGGEFATIGKVTNSFNSYNDRVPLRTTYIYRVRSLDVNDTPYSAFSNEAGISIGKDSDRKCGATGIEFLLLLLIVTRKRIFKALERRIDKNRGGR